MTTKNAMITGYKLGIERGFAVTLWLYLEYGDSSHQGFGGSVLHNATKPSGGDYAGAYIAKVLGVVGVEDLADVVGKTIRAEAHHAGVDRIGHITKDIWFAPIELFPVGVGSDN